MEREDRMRIDYESAQERIDFLEGELAEVQKELEAALRDLKDFKVRYYSLIADRQAVL
jgi:hypothetical protein